MMPSSPRRTHFRLVCRVDEQDETPRLIFGVETELWHVNEEDGVECLGDLEVVGGAEGFPTQLDEFEQGGGRRGEGNVDFTTPDSERTVLDNLFRPGEGFEELGDLASIVLVDRVKVDLA